MQQQERPPRSSAKVVDLFPVDLGRNSIDLHACKDNRFPVSGTQTECYRLCCLRLRGSSKKAPQFLNFARNHPPIFSQKLEIQKVTAKYQFQ